MKYISLYNIEKISVVNNAINRIIKTSFSLHSTIKCKKNVEKIWRACDSIRVCSVVNLNALSLRQYGLRVCFRTQWV